MIKGLLIEEPSKEKMNDVKTVIVKSEDDCCRIIKCIRTNVRKYEVGGKRYSFIYDNAFLFNDKIQMTVATCDGYPLIVGNVYICGFEDNEGVETSLTDADIENIKSHLRTIEFLNGITGNVLLIDKSIAELRENDENYSTGIDECLK